MSELPNGWASATLGQVCDRGKYGWTTKAANEGDMKFLRTTDITKGPINWATVPYCEESPSDLDAYLLKPGDIVISRAGSVGFSALIDHVSEPSVFASYLIRFVPADQIEAKYIAAFLRSPDYWKQVGEASAGIALANVNASKLAEVSLPLAPAAEQKRIADKLEAVLGRVDACRARLDRVPDLLKHFRQSVLAAATSGQLTESWRATRTAQESWLDSVKHKPVVLPANYKRLSKQSFKPTIIEHGADELPTTWSVHTIRELYDLKVLVDFADGNHGGLYPRKEEFGSEGALFLTATQMDDRWTVALDQCPRLNWTKAKQLVKGWARNFDVLLSHNATVGRVGLIEGSKEDVLLGTSVTFYRFNPRFILPRYARIVFSSHFFQEQLRSCMEQTTRDQVPITKQVSLNFVCAPVPEQQEIVRRVEALFAFADRIEARLTGARAYMERLTPATLAKAFRGELVPQDPNDEPANALLERLLTAKKTEAAQPKPGRAPLKRIMKTSTRESVIGAIRSMNKDKFSFSELRENVQGDYEALTEAVFRILADEKPILKQVFNTKAKVMQFQRSKT